MVRSSVQSFETACCASYTLLRAASRPSFLLAVRRFWFAEDEAACGALQTCHQGRGVGHSEIRSKTAKIASWHGLLARRWLRRSLLCESFRWELASLKCHLAFSLCCASPKCCLRFQRRLGLDGLQSMTVSLVVDGSNKLPCLRVASSSLACFCDCLGWCNSLLSNCGVFT